MGLFHSGSRNHLTINTRIKKLIVKKWKNIESILWG